MTNEEEIIKSTFKEYYWDLGVYRLANRNKKEIKMFFGLSFIGVFIFALMGLYPPLIVWSFLLPILVHAFQLTQKDYCLM